MADGPVSLVVLNLNGRALLRSYLPTLVAARSADPRIGEIILVDNGSTDGSVEYVRENFPGITVIALGRNAGFGKACNIGIRRAAGRYVMLLNNDVGLDAGFLAPLLERASDPAVFSVQPYSRGTDNRGRPAPAGAQYIPFSCGGYVLYDREKFLGMGGFHDIYLPIYVEDRDVGHRAWKRGWKNIVEPRSIVYHEGEQTCRRMRRVFIERLKFRNRCIFYLSALDDPVQVVTRVLLLFLSAFSRFRWTSYGAVWDLVRLRGAIAGKRAADRPFWKRTDREIRRFLRQRVQSEKCKV